MSSHILTVTSPSHKEIISVLSGYLSGKCDILDLAQFNDSNTRKFFMRASFTLKKHTCMKNFLIDFQPIIQQFSLNISIRNAKERMKTLILVSRFDHCLHDLLYQWNARTLAMDIAGIVSNHPIYQKLAIDYQIPFYYIPITKQNKIKCEEELINIIEKNNVELLILARYMQILSEKLCQKMSGRIINIHHSFLPSFKGGNPYKQAYEYGVKIIGATAHYVTPALDEGPIIEQDVVHITHAQNIKNYISIGRNIETKVLSNAVNAHIQHRVFINERKTVVFPTQSNDYPE
ncbi:Formyltetrahydrofolate deformylase [Candidatus Liberibacter solanacearum]|uniref:Formyltetrahydrofolate deformylase n=1 Tax=Candidatus Liberibacter solanacearum TaxID=556287 RepID=A0A424FLF8_9HYPH|nr:formyltetrahydrofolate deformylase [Candidatus Liberibacter solanacearum]RPD36980.1 formyltetrahydrofolate deformylase [Candidatus Liberibacter solanacearum]